MLVWWPSVIPVISFYITPCWYGVNQSDPTNGVRRSSVSLIVIRTDVVAVRQPDSHLIVIRTNDPPTKSGSSLWSPAVIR